MPILCHQCGRPAVFEVGSPESRIPLCLDCDLKYNQVLALERQALERHINYLVSQAEFVTGVRGIVPRFPESQVISVGNVFLNNIQVESSHIGLLNAGTISSVDTAITSLRDTGATEFADAIKTLTEAVAASAVASQEIKNQLIDLLSFASTEALTPPERRRRGAIRPALTEMATLMSGIEALSNLWHRYWPVIARTFSLET